MKNLLSVLVAVMMVSMMSCSKGDLIETLIDCEEVEADVFLGAYELDDVSRLYLSQEEGELISFQNNEGVIIEMEQVDYIEETTRINGQLLCSSPASPMYYEYYEGMKKEVNYSASLPDGSDLHIKGQVFIGRYADTDGLYDQVGYEVTRGSENLNFTAFPFVHQGEVNPNLSADVDTELHDVSLSDMNFTGVLINTTPDGTIYVHPEEGLVAFKFNDASVYTKK